VKPGKIQSIEVNQNRYMVGRCLPGDCFSPAIEEIKDETIEFPDSIHFMYGVYGKHGQRLARIENCPVIVVFEPEQKEAPTV
jgi:hypothetical protein